MRRVIVAITGASGTIFGIKTLEILRAHPEVEIHFVISPAGIRTMKEETDFTLEQVRELAHVCYHFRDTGAAISSGSFLTHGMIVAPCSIKTLSGVAHAYDDDLIVRAADVCLKERRRVVLLLRETPLHAGHIDLMAQATRSGAIIMPPVPAFYFRPTSLAEIIEHTVYRALDLLDLSDARARRWRTDEAKEQQAKPHDD